MFAALWGLGDILVPLRTCNPFIGWIKCLPHWGHWNLLPLKRESIFLLVIFKLDIKNEKQELKWTKLKKIKDNVFIWDFVLIFSNLISYKYSNEINFLL